MLSVPNQALRFFQYLWGQYFLAATVLSVFGLATIAPLCTAVATPTDEDTSLWVPIHLDVPITPKWTFETEPQFRWNEGITHAGQQQWRNAFNYAFNEHVNVTAGHMWTARHANNQPLFSASTTYENRLYQDVDINHALPLNWKADHRIRLEQRLFQEVEDPVWYLRYRMGFSHALGASGKTRFVQSNELLNHLNRVGSVPSGLVQQRYFVGINHEFNPTVNVDAGYLVVLSDQFARPRNSLNHVLFFQVNLRPTPPWERTAPSPTRQNEATPSHSPGMAAVRPPNPVEYR